MIIYLNLIQSDYKLHTIILRMSEIITINIGGYGTRVGNKFYHKLSQQYENSEGSQLNKQILMKSNDAGKAYSPRAIFIDTDSKLLSMMQKDNKGLSYKPQQIIAGKQSCRNLFSEGRYCAGNQIIDEFQDAVRKQVEQCDSFSGFIIISAIGGGTGGGLGSSCLSKLSEGSQRWKIVENYTLMPCISQNDVINHLQVYNSVLSAHYHVEYSNLEIMLQNNAVERSLLKKGMLHPGIDALNDHMARGLIQNTAPYIYRGSLNTNQRKKCTNIILFPRMKFLIPGLSDRYSKHYVQSSFQPYNRFVNQKELSRIYSTYISVRDPHAFENQINIEAHKQLNKYGHIAEWISNPFGLSITNYTQKNYGTSAWSLVNCVKSCQRFKQLGELFTAQFRRKAFLHHYTAGGMDQMQFTEAQSNCNDLVSQYTPCCLCAYDEDEDQESEI